MTAPGGVTKNWVLVTCDLKEGRCQVRSSYGVITKVREQKLAKVGSRRRGEWAKTQSKAAEHLATPQVCIAHRQLCTFTHGCRVHLTATCKSVSTSLFPETLTFCLESTAP